MEIFAGILITGWIISMIIAVVIIVKHHLQFKKGDNPFHRICRKCGAHQVEYDRFGVTQWEEIYPIGNDENCSCHSYAHNRG
jgi:hypothetical protein